MQKFGIYLKQKYNTDRPYIRCHQKFKITQKIAQNTTRVYFKRNT